MLIRGIRIGTFLSLILWAALVFLGYEAVSCARAATVSANIAITVTGPSPSGTCIGPAPCAATSITDSAGTIWTVVGGFSYENGVVDGGANITTLLYYGGIIYANTTSYGWWLHTAAGGWVQATGDPRPVAPPPLAMSCPATATVFCGAPAGTVVANCSTTGGDGNPLTFALPPGLTSFALGTGSRPPITVAPGNIVAADCPTPPATVQIKNVTVTVTQP